MYALVDYSGVSTSLWWGARSLHGAINQISQFAAYFTWSVSILPIQCEISYIIAHNDKEVETLALLSYNSV